MASSSGSRGLTDDLKHLEFETSEEVNPVPTFDELGLRQELLRGIYAYGKLFLVLMPAIAFYKRWVTKVSLNYFQDLKNLRLSNKERLNQS